MIVPFAVDPDALLMPHADRAEQLAVHRRLLTVWRDVGVLVHGADSWEHSDLARSVRMLPQHIRDLWLKALKHQRTLPRGESWISLSSCTDIHDLASLRQQFDVACLEETRAACLSLPFDQVSVVIDGLGPEICRFPLADQATRFAVAIELSRKPVRKGEPVDEIWHTRFAPAARYSRAGAVLVDRYAFISHVQRRDGLSGLRRMLVELEKTLRGQNVTIFAAYNDEIGPDRVLSAAAELAAERRAGGVRALQIFLGHDKVFAANAHYRYLRLGHTVCQIDVGIGILAGHAAYTHCPFFLVPDSGEHTREESRLRNLLSPKEFACGLSSTIPCAEVGRTDLASVT